jgi:hypothetical protein
MESLDILGRSKHMIEVPVVNLESNEEPTTEQPIENILEKVEYVEPNPNLPVPEGMCFNCDIENIN